MSMHALTYRSMQIMFSLSWTLTTWIFVFVISLCSVIGFYSVLCFCRQCHQFLQCHLFLQSHIWVFSGQFSTYSSIIVYPLYKHFQKLSLHLLGCADCLRFNRISDNMNRMDFLMEKGKVLKRLLEQNPQLRAGPDLK